MEPIYIRQGFQKYSDMRQGYFLNSRCDMAINKRQRHATLALLKIDRRHGDPRQPLSTSGTDGGRARGQIDRWSQSQ